ncbi:hypothetical protein JAAN108728_13505 [Janibacter anophelis]
MKIKRMTTDAWAVAQELAQGETQAGFRPVRKRTANELRVHGIISGDDVLDPSGSDSCRCWGVHLWSSAFSPATGMSPFTPTSSSCRTSHLP